MCGLSRPAYTAFVDVQSRGHRETWPVRSREFTLWLQHRYFHAHRGAPNRAALRAALDMVEAQGRFEGAHNRVFRRVASLGNRLYLDLANSAWKAVEIGATGWRVVDQPPVRFTRSPTTRALPTPEPGGRLSDLRPHLNLASDDDFVLLTSWILAALRDTGPYPVLVLLGEQGSAKSTTMRIVRSVTDPLEAPVRTLPRSERDLYIEAANSHLLAYDNVSAVPLWLSDALCRLSTGGGISTRRLYTDASELVIGGSHPTILNGIDEFVTRGDLADRTIFLHVPVIPETRYATEAAVWARFERERSRILGALLDAVSTGIDSHADVRREGLPRMSDFAAWAIACESAKSRGAFLRAYERNRAEAVASVIDTSPVASAVRIWMEESLMSWTGEAAALYAELTRTADPGGIDRARLAGERPGTESATESSQSSAASRGHFHRERAGRAKAHTDNGPRAQRRENCVECVKTRRKQRVRRNFTSCYRRGGTAHRTPTAWCVNFMNTEPANASQRKRWSFRASLSAMTPDGPRRVWRVPGCAMGDRARTRKRQPPIRDRGSPSDCVAKGEHDTL